MSAVSSVLDYPDYLANIQVFPSVTRPLSRFFSNHPERYVFSSTPFQCLKLIFIRQLDPLDMMDLSVEIITSSFRCVSVSVSTIK